MIRRDANGGWILITQHDHALLAGSVMRYWGNELFSRPEPFDEVLFAIGEHDCGWTKWDSRPKVNPENGYPANFMEMETGDQSEIWRRSFESHSGSHPYASSLIALHFAKFNRNVLRRDPSIVPAINLRNEMENFLADKLGTDAANPDLSAVPGDVRINLRLLQAGDIISLAVCHGWEKRDITDVPLDYEGSVVDLKMQSGDGFNYTVSPYPFSEPLIEFQIRGRKLDRKSFSGDEELRRCLESAEIEILDFTIRKG